MKKTKSSTKRFGPRYGRRIRERLDKIERKQKKIYKCPYCHYKKVSRLLSGIWQCKKCSAKFTGKAYEV